MNQKDYLKKFRDEFGWSQSKAAEEVGVGLRAWQMWEAEQGTTSWREAPPMLYQVLELRRQLRSLGAEDFSWDAFNEEQARKSGAMLLKPNKATYGAKD